MQQRASIRLLVLLLLVFLPPSVQAQPKPWDPACIVGGVPTLKCLETVFANVVNVAIALAGIILLIIIITAGFRYITSAGDPKAIGLAGQTLTWAFVGMTLVIVSWFILKLVEQITGVPVTIFRITL